jgi:ketosteroid isomerase-like protein
MENISVKGLLLCGATTLLFSCNSGKDGAAVSATDKEQIKKEIQAKEDEFASLYNNGELRNIGYYADDATTFFQNREPLVGKEAIVAFLRADLSANSRNKISYKTNEVFVSSDGNQVVEIGYFTVADSSNTTLNSGNYMSRVGQTVAIKACNLFQ